ncbi:MAG TPA: hypothetical protein VF530_20315 [Planctomycetota bacterium]
MSLVFRLAAPLLVPLLAPVATAQLGAERQVLAAPGAPPATAFGSKLAHDADVAVIGAPDDADLGFRAGAAYVYGRDPLLGWTLARKLTATDGAAEDLFGYALAVDGATVLVGAFTKNGATPGEGAVYVFARDQGGPDAWGQRAKLVSPAPGERDYFGYSLAVDGDTLAIGSPRQDAPGSVYLYARDALAPSGWTLTHELQSADPATGFSFGYALAFEGDTLVVTGSRTAGFSTSYALHVRERDAGGPDQWGETQRIERPRGNENDFFGFRIALSGGTLAVPSWEYVLDRERFGVVYLYERGASGFEHVALANTGLVQMPPQALDVEGDWLAVGTIYEPSGPLHDVGAVVLFHRDAGGGGQWGEVAALQPAQPRDDAYFGFAVDLAGERLLAGAPDDFYEPGAGPGTAHELDLGRVARATWRNDTQGRNPDVLASVTRPRLGTTWRAQVELPLAGRDQALLLGFLRPGERPLARASVQLGRELIGILAESSPGAFELALPPQPGLIGLRLVAQAALTGGGPGYTLTNALDLVLAVE